VELIFFPGIVVLAVTGLLLMFGSLLWGMADIWPDEPISLSGDLFTRPLINLGLAAAIGGVLILLLLRFLPRGWFFQQLAITNPIAGSAQMAGGAPEVAQDVDDLVGRKGVAVTGLYPSGQVDVNGRRYEARLMVGSAPAGSTVVVRSRSDFGVVVEVVPS
jgi:membrane-bound serine protease (ClpP class)